MHHISGWTKPLTRPGLSSEAALRHEAAESAMDGSRDPRAGTRRTVKVLRRFYEKDAPRSEERLGVCPSSSGHLILADSSALMPHVAPASEALRLPC